MIQRVWYFILIIIFHLILTNRIHAQLSQLFINEFMASNEQTIADEAGEYEDWIEIYNSSDEAVDISRLFLTDDLNNPTKWPCPDISIPARGFLIIWADENRGQGTCHANFKLSSSGEQIGIFNGSHFLDSLTYGAQYTDLSFGRYPDGTKNWFFFSRPTPGSLNDCQNIRFAENPNFLPTAGFFRDSVIVKITVSSSNAAIFYTLDGSEPTDTSLIYTEPIIIPQTTVIRAKTFEVGYYPSRVVTMTYIINHEFDIATLSLVTDPPNLWDPDSGIYVNPKQTGDAWERPVSIEFFDVDHRLCCSVAAGIRISGEYSREYEKKSFRLYFRAEYGPSWLNYPLFPSKGHIGQFKRLSVHSGSTDMPINPYGYGWTLLRDPIMYELGRKTGCIQPANRPVAVFLNGEPWGIYNLMERLDRYFTGSNFNESNVDLIENGGAREGDVEQWNQMISFFENHNLVLESNYIAATALIDVNNFTNYNIVEIFGGNGDWPHHNLFAYRPRKEGALWRWILWDMDGCLGPYGVYDNTLRSATREDPSTLILRKLLDNNNYKNFFINRFADLLNTTFDSTNVNKLIDSLAAIIRNDISFETKKWGSSPIEWQGNGLDEELHNFAHNRPDIVRSQIRQKFDLEGQFTLTIEAPQGGTGKIRINSIVVNDYPWNGLYFKGVPIELEALPDPRYRFKQWSDSSLSPVKKMSIVLNEDFCISPEFEIDQSDNYLIINEINYHSAPDFDPGDWIELYNPLEREVDLTNWLLKDDNEVHYFIFPESTTINSHAFLVVCQNQSDFHRLFPEVNNYLGNFEFGLNGGGDVVRIYNDAYSLIDSVQYDDSPPWPTAPDGSGPTLELIDPRLDNNLAENWQASIQHGTPGQVNLSVISTIDIKPELSQVPDRYALFQNFPNPFNALTQIRFQLPEPAYVQITIYNLIGDEIKTLVHEFKSTGSYCCLWNGKDHEERTMPSGIYMYQLKSDRFIQIKKMMLMR